jgi:hypothetical protein
VTKLYVVVQTRPEKPEGVDYFELQGVFSTRDLARAACRNDRYLVWEEDLDVALPDETTVAPNPEWPRIYQKQYDPSPLAADTIARYLEQGFHGGEPNADGTFTHDTWKVDQGQRKRYYPAACAAEWFHDSARLWAMVDDLTHHQSDADLIEEFRRLARRAYEIAYRWQRGALSGLPEYASWQEEPETA